MSSSPFTEMRSRHADHLAALLCPQGVCPLALSPKCTLVTLLLPFSTLSLYVLLSFYPNAPC